jgi:predicted dienelactone hydrolase
MVRGTTRRLVLVVAVIAALAGGAAGAARLAGWATDHAVETTGPYRVGTRTATFVDDTRPTPAFGGTPAAPNRTVVTDIWYPAAGNPDDAPVADAPAADGPFPLVVFNHGQQGEPQQYAPSFEVWARAGYVVAAPRHPLTVGGGPGAVFADDAQGEIGDVAFVIDSIDEKLSDLADVDHVAVAGHSSGVLVTFTTTFEDCCHDDRIDAALLEGTPVPLGQQSAGLAGTPVMFVQGDADPTPPAVPHAAYDAADSPKVFLTVPGGDHSGIYRDAPAAPDVARAALAFLDWQVKGRDGALDTLENTPGIEIAR